MTKIFNLVQSLKIFKEKMFMSNLLEILEHKNGKIH